MGEWGTLLSLCVLVSDGQNNNNNNNKSLSPILIHIQVGKKEKMSEA